MRVRFTPSAIAHLREISAHYREIDEGVERRFLDSLDMVVDRLITFPRGAPPVEGFAGVRRARMRRFPYGVFYRLEADSILILRVLHSRRDQGEIEEG